MAFLGQSLASAPLENLADKQFINIAITYSTNGKITGYRNGELYGKSYSVNLYKYQKNKSVLTFGLRHLPASPQRMLDGIISKASVYDRALSQSEINAIFHSDSHVSLEEVVNSLSYEERPCIQNLPRKENL